MDFTAFSPGPALVGGVVIGLAASLLWLTLGRVAGISGIVGGLFSSTPGERLFRVAFLTGLVAVGIVASFVQPTSLASSPLRGPAVMLVAGIVVGIGTRLGNGCTSGHGVCGLSRFSLRSLVATITFMATAMLTVAVVRIVTGGAL